LPEAPLCLLGAVNDVTVEYGCERFGAHDWLGRNLRIGFAAGHAKMTILAAITENAGIVGAV